MRVNDTADAVAEMLSLSRRAQLIIWLQRFTRRNLAVEQPRDSEKLISDLGVGASGLDRFIRPWVNDTYRVPDGKARLAPGTLDSTTTFKQLCGFAGA